MPSLSIIVLLPPSAIVNFSAKSSGNFSTTSWATSCPNWPWPSKIHVKKDFGDGDDDDGVDGVDDNDVGDDDDNNKFDRKEDTKTARSWLYTCDLPC